MVQLSELSRIGFGAYRVSSKSQNDYRVLKFALSKGCNLIDTAANYMNGHSEELIGNLTTEYKKLFIITKAGYIQEDTIKEVKKVFKKTDLQDNFIHFSDTFTYSLHPAYLKWQMYKSLKRLNRKYIDGFLLHNPEYYLKTDANFKDIHEFYGIIKQAFEFLEEMVERGLIRYYGISSNILPLSLINPVNINLEKIISIASEVSVTNHFKIIQFPFNLNERDAATIHQGNESLIQRAGKFGLTTFSNRPLNSQNIEGIIRFATYEKHLSKLDEQQSEIIMQDCLQTIQNRLNSLGIEEDLLSFPVIKLLHESWKNIGNPEAVQKIFNDFLNPFLHQLYMGKVPSSKQRKFSLLQKKCILFSKRELTRKSLVYKQNLINERIISSSDQRPLSVIACQYSLNSGINHVLVGMKHMDYVKDFKDFFKHL